ncbi:MAG: LysR family transcriptional regulator [Anaerolineae bacterium]|nr:LysR family transcriptional regulator [Anaerolineae bacterium]
MELKQVEYFLMVTKMGNFTNAADELFISQSSLSKRIIALEQELDCSLFDRSKRKIALTPAGEAFLIHARGLMQTYQAMLSEMTQYKITPALAIVAIPVIAQYGIPSYLARFRRTFPTIQFTLEEREAAAILPALHTHQFDLAFLRDNYLDRTQYTCLDVAPDKLLVVLSPHHRLVKRPVLSLAELADENFIMFDKGTVVHEIAVEACRRAGFMPRIFYASLRVESILGLVASQVGIALMMEKVYAYHQHANVVALPLEEVIESHVVLAWMKDKKLSRPARAFVEFVEKVLAI